MHFFPEELEQYSVAHTKQASEVLQELERETYARIYMPQMVSGHLQGRFLSMISKLVQPKNILELMIIICHRLLAERSLWAVIRLLTK